MYIVARFLPVRNRHRLLRFFLHLLYVSVILPHPVHPIFLVISQQAGQVLLTSRYSFLRHKCDALQSIDEAMPVLQNRQFLSFRCQGLQQRPAACPRSLVYSSA